MHRCLLVPDIFARVLDFVEVELPEHFYSACHAFKEPSLNVLWKNQFTLAPLVKTLPEDAWDEVSESEPEPYNEPDTIYYYLNIKRPLTSSDWTRFDYYAGRIQSLGYLDCEFADEEGVNWKMPNVTTCERPVNSTIIAHIARYRPRRWLLPNLVRIRWAAHNYEYTDYLPLFLGPRLKTLAIAVGPHDQWLDPDQYKPEVLCSILEAIPASCPSCTGIEIEPDHDLSVIEAADVLAGTNDNLEVFTVDGSRCCSMQDMYVDYLSKKPHLRKVWLGFYADTLASLQSLWAANAYPFSSLSNLSIMVCRLQVCTEFLTLLRQCRLVNITVEVKCRPKAAEIHAFYDTLQRRCARNTLLMCRLLQDIIHTCEEYSNDSDILSDPVHRVGMDELAPALHFPHLRYFILNVPVLGYFVDEDIMRMADAWPGMIAFSLVGGCGGGPVLRNPVTWKGVGYLVSRCTQLADIKIAFDTTSDNVEEITRLPDFRPNHWMRFLNVLDSTLSNDSEHFARSLFAIAPRIVRVFADGWTDDPDGPLQMDPYAFCEQLEIIMCMLRKMYMSDVYDLNELGDDVTNHTKEWNAWG